MSTETEGSEPHVSCVDVSEKVKENESICEIVSDSGLEIVDSISAKFLDSDSADASFKPVNIDGNFSNLNTFKHSVDNATVIDSPTNLDENSKDSHDFKTNMVPEGSDCNLDISSEINKNEFTSIHKELTNSTNSLTDHTPIENTIINKTLFSRSAENLSNILHQPNKDLNTDEILSDFTNHKVKISAVQKIPENLITSDPKYSRIPKELLSQDIGSIVKNVHGIFSSVSGSLKNAYTHRTSHTQKPVKAVKNITNGKLMNDIFEDENFDPQHKREKSDYVNSVENMTISKSIDIKLNDEISDVKSDIIKLHVESLEKMLGEQRKENESLREKLKQQCDELQQKDQSFKDFENKFDIMSKRVESAEREKDAAVMRYASVECAAIEARRAAENAAKAEKNAHLEVELLNGKLKSAHSEKQRICQLYDDKCHELMNCERELSKVREDVKELEGRLKWTQSKLRIEMDAYKESSERAEKLSQQVMELETAKEAAAVNASDSAKAKHLESKLQESQAALILSRHERDELERKLTTTVQQLNDCTRERDAAVDCLTKTTVKVEELKVSNLRLEEEAAELAALRAKASLADTLSAQLQREAERAACAEEALSVERALAETCGRREAAALEHAARLTAAHVAHSAAAQRHEDEARALSADNVSLRERLFSLESECLSLQTALSEETDRRNKENRVLARKVAELTEEVAEANKKLEWEKGENAVLKKKHCSAIKELNRELQRTLKRCEQLEAKLSAPDAPSTRAGSISSLSSGESAPQEDRLQNGRSDTIPDIQVREPDRQTLIERIVSLQRAGARRAERCEFLEEHARQLTAELRRKARLLRHALAALPAGALADTQRDNNKKELARLGGSMAALWGGDPAGMTAELSLEVNRRLQAVLEDTLLKNITLKENMDTLGAEISRLKEQLKTVNDTK